MNNEPIQFLPVERFWEKAERERKTNLIFCAGMIVGASIAVVSADLIIFILSRI